jgi:hypothetical protein
MFRMRCSYIIFFVISAALLPEKEFPILTDRRRMHRPRSWTERFGEGRNLLPLSRVET